MDYLNPAVRLGRHSCKLAVHLRTPPTHSRNDDFPQTFIQQVSVSLDDPDHSLTLTWTGPKADTQEKGPFRTSPGAGLKGLNCDDDATSGSQLRKKCTPKGTLFQCRASNEGSIAILELRTLRGLSKAEALRFTISPLCLSPRPPTAVYSIELVDVARLIQDNSLVDDTEVVVSGTWTKPSKQWD